jgi:hypothetical protein
MAVSRVQLVHLMLSHNDAWKFSPHCRMADRYIDYTRLIEARLLCCCLANDAQHALWSGKDYL